MKSFLLLIIASLSASINIDAFTPIFPSNFANRDITRSSRSDFASRGNTALSAKYNNIDDILEQYPSESPGERIFYFTETIFLPVLCFNISFSIILKFSQGYL